jgi:hypothetical protein
MRTLSVIETVDKLRQEKEAQCEQIATGSEKPPYQPKKREIASIKAALAAKESQAPSLKLKTKGDSKGNQAQFTVDHPHELVGTIDLMRAVGTTDENFFGGLLRQLINASGKTSEADANFLLSVIKGVEPRDQIEAMLAAQMGAVHVASIAMAGQLAQAKTLLHQETAERGLSKLTRTFAGQVEALKSYRSKGEQRMVVQHVNVADGGQAIVGNVNAPVEGGGAKKKIGDQPHALAYAPGVEMSRQVEKEREKVPITGG